MGRNPVFTKTEIEEMHNRLLAKEVTYGELAVEKDRTTGTIKSMISRYRASIDKADSTNPPNPHKSSPRTNPPPEPL